LKKEKRKKEDLDKLLKSNYLTILKVIYSVQSADQDTADRLPVLEFYSDRQLFHGSASIHRISLFWQSPHEAIPS
jgi:hypothetical protein